MHEIIFGVDLCEQAIAYDLQSPVCANVQCVFYLVSSIAFLANSVFTKSA